MLSGSHPLETTCKDEYINKIGEPLSSLGVTSVIMLLFVLVGARLSKNSNSPCLLLDLVMLSRRDYLGQGKKK